MISSRRAVWNNGAAGSFFYPSRYLRTYLITFTAFLDPGSRPRIRRFLLQMFFQLLFLHEHVLTIKTHSISIKSKSSQKGKKVSLEHHMMLEWRFLALFRQIQNHPTTRFFSQKFCAGSWGLEWKARKKGNSLLTVPGRASKSWFYPTIWRK